jgi:hypothetical protein
VFVSAAAGVALLVTYPYGTLALATLAYLCTIPISYRRFERRLYEPAAQTAGAELMGVPEESSIDKAPATETKH